jgi:hypothetical protein
MRLAALIEANASDYWAASMAFSSLSVILGN